jgi:type I restriction enzyme S subunit
MSDDAISKAFSAAEPYAHVETFAASSKEVRAGARRLEGAFYGSAGYRALRSMQQSGLEMTTVGSLARVVWLGPFGRIYVEDRSAGVPFLSSSEMIEARPTPSNYLSRALSRNLDAILVREGTILISRSGTIGNVAICTADFDGLGVSEHAIRVMANDPHDRGLIYAFLQSEAGQFLVKRSKSGSVVESIYEADVSGLPIPLLPKALRREMTRLVDEACRCRAEANGLLNAADEAVWRQNYLDRRSMRSDLGFEVMARPSSALLTQYESTVRIRLEATFQSHRARSAEKLARAAAEWKPLREVVRAIPYTGPGSMPGVPKVDGENGIHTVTGRDLGLARPSPSYFLAKTNQRVLSKMIPERGTTLIMCAGTLGKTDYVSGNYESWAVSLDVIRVIPDPQKLHSGYVYAFLTSDLGQGQMLRHKYGSVIPRIHSRQVAELSVPVPQDKGQSIGDKVDLAFEMRARAVSLENQAIGLFGAALERGREYVESEWGSEY